MKGLGAEVTGIRGKGDRGRRFLPGPLGKLLGRGSKGSKE
jgi:hypothetical protein